MIVYQIFRCWAVYNRSWRVTVLPLLLWLYNISIVVLSTYEVIDGGNGFINFHDVNEMMLLYYPVIITINIYATCK